MYQQDSLFEEFPPSRKTIYEWVWLRRRWIDTAMALLLLTAVVTAVVGAPLWLVAGVTALVLVGGLMWVALPMYLHVFGQLTAWYLVRCLRWATALPRDLSRVKLGIALVLVGITYLLWPEPQLSVPWLLPLAMLLVIAGILWLVWSSRSRLFIDDVRDLTAAEGKVGIGPQLSAQLRAELAAIAKTYSHIDEVLPRQAVEHGLLELRIGVQDKAAEFTEAIGNDFNIKIFGVSLPIGKLLSIANLVWKAPRLQGSFYRVEQEGAEEGKQGGEQEGEKRGGQFVLLVQVVGGEREGQWRVTRQGTSKESAVPHLVEEMAFHLLTGLRDVGSPRWEAVKAFTHGLREIRQVQRCRQDYHRHLRQAERAFLEALSQDCNFRQCHFNLGVVYQLLGQKESARATFRKAIEVDPTHLDAVLAMARNAFDDEKWRNAATFLGGALKRAPSEPNAWNLLGRALAGTELELQQYDCRIDQCFGLASALAWRRLCWTILLRGVGSDDSRAAARLAATITGNVAERWLRLPRTLDALRKSLRWNQQARRLRPDGPYLHYLRGLALCLGGWREAACQALYSAFGEGLEPSESAVRWACLAQCESDQTARDQAKKQFQCFVVPPEGVVLGPANLREHWRYLKILKDLRDELGWLRRSYPGQPGEAAELKWCQERIAEIRAIEKGEELPKSTEKWWVDIQQALKAGRKALEESAEGDAVLELVDQGRRGLKKAGLDRQIERQGIDSLRARALVRASQREGAGERLKQALLDAESSVHQAPMSAARRWILAEVFNALRDTHQFTQESKLALALGTVPELLGQAETLNQLAKAWFHRVEIIPDPTCRGNGFDEARSFFKDLLELIESAPGESKLHAAHAALHFWLGRFDLGAGRRVEAAEQLEVARALGYETLATTQYLAEIYRDLGCKERADHLLAEIDLPSASG